MGQSLLSASTNRGLNARHVTLGNCPFFCHVHEVSGVFFASCFTSNKWRWGKHVLSWIPLPQDRSHVDSWYWLCAHVCCTWRPVCSSLLSITWQKMNAVGRSLIETTVRSKSIPTIPTASCKKKNENKIRDKKQVYEVYDGSKHCEHLDFDGSL